MLHGFLGENSPKVGCTIRMDFRNKLLGVQFLVRPVFDLIFVSASGSDTSQKRIDVLVYWPDIKTHCQNHYHQEPEPTTQDLIKMGRREMGILIPKGRAAWCLLGFASLCSVPGLGRGHSPVFLHINNETYLQVDNM